MCGNYGARPGQHSSLIAVKRGREQVALHPVRFHAFSDTRSLYYSNSAPRPFPTRRPPWIPPPPPPSPPLNHYLHHIHLGHHTSHGHHPNTRSCSAAFANSRRKRSAA